MPGVSDSQQPDDIRVHLEHIKSADDAQAATPDGESAQDALVRNSVRLPTSLRARFEASLQELQQKVPGLSAAEVAKLTTSRAGRDALNAGMTALARVDSHLQSVTGERNPIIARTYGVFSDNPRSFGGVFRALGQSLTENARLTQLPPDHPDRRLLFTPLVAAEVAAAHKQLTAILGTRITTRAELSRGVALKAEVVDEALATLGAVRNHLYANLPLRKRDPDLRDYGFRPVQAAGRGGGDEEEGDEDAGDRGQQPIAAGPTVSTG